jgi:hypothetical protein
LVVIGPVNCRKEVGEMWDDEWDDDDDDEWDEVTAWLIEHPNAGGKPKLTEELWQEMHDDAVMGGYGEDE